MNQKSLEGHYDNVGHYTVEHCDTVGHYDIVGHCDTVEQSLNINVVAVAG